MKVQNDMMLVGPAGRAVMNRLIDQPRQRRRHKSRVGRGVVPIFVPFVDSSLSTGSSFEDDVIERVDYEKYGERADTRFQRDMRRMAAREALPTIIEQKLELVEDEAGKLPALEDIRTAQKGREIYHLAVLSRCPPVTETESEVATEPATVADTPEIVHPPVGDTASAQYVAAQDALEAEFARMNPLWYLQLNGGHHGANIMVSDVARAQRDVPDFDERMHAAMARIEPIIKANPRRHATFQEVSAPQNNNAPARRDSERP